MTTTTQPPAVNVAPRSTRARLEARLGRREFKNSHPVVGRLLAGILDSARQHHRAGELNLAQRLPQGKSLVSAIKAICGSEPLQIKIEKDRLLLRSPENGFVEVLFAELEAVELELLASIIHESPAGGRITLHAAQEQRWKDSFLARFRKRRD